MNSIRIKSCAKVNLGLKIVSKREDGFHNIETIFYPVKDLNDYLIFTKDNDISFKCDTEIPGSTEDNLIYKAIRLLESEVGKKLGVKINLNKNIPVGAGLGGGSSNAAATLIAMNKLFKLGLPKPRLAEFALELGSDVPFFLISQPAIAHSRGELLKPINFQIAYPIVLINPGIHISTKYAFENLKNFSTGSFKTVKNPESFDDITSFNSIFKNDFEAVICEKYPDVLLIKKKLLDSGAGFALMTGTGSTLFGIYKDIASAEKALKNFPDYYFQFISRPTTAVK